MAINRRKAIRGAKTLGYGAAGNLIGSGVGVAVSRTTGASLYGSTKAGAALGTAGGLFVGGMRASHTTPSVKATRGDKAFKRRVGTKTNARVGKKDNPYTPPSHVQKMSKQVEKEQRRAYKDIFHD